MASILNPFCTIVSATTHALRLKTNIIAKIIKYSLMNQDQKNQRLHEGTRSNKQTRSKKSRARQLTKGAQHSSQPREGIHDSYTLIKQTFVRTMGSLCQWFPVTRNIIITYHKRQIWCWLDTFLVSPGTIHTSENTVAIAEIKRQIIESQFLLVIITKVTLNVSKHRDWGLQFPRLTKCKSITTTHRDCEGSMDPPSANEEHRIHS